VTGEPAPDRPVTGITAKLGLCPSYSLWYTDIVVLTVTLEREEDGRWIADIPELPGVMRYGNTPEEAVHAAKSLALYRLADMLEHGELTDELTDVTFARAA
jgi:predicted RNase H-like HicB family nuclease